MKKNLREQPLFFSDIMDPETEFIPLLSSEDEEAMNAENVPDILPILPLKNTVLFPGVVIPITVGRDKSIKLIKDYYKGDRIIGTVAQKDSGIEDPEFSSPVRTLMQDSSHPSIIYVGTGAEGVYRLSLKAAQPKKQIEVNETDGRRRTKSQNDTTSRESTLMISTEILSGRLQD